MTSFAHELHAAIERKGTTINGAAVRSSLRADYIRLLLTDAALPTEREAVALATALCVTGRYWTAFMAAAGVAGEDADAA